MRDLPHGHNGELELMTTNNGTLAAAGSRKPEKATITNVENSESFEVLFNPTEYSLSKTNNWRRITIRESNVAPPEFLGGNPSELRMQLFFDTYEKHEDVRDYTNKIIELTKIGDYDGVLRPPRCLFSWGRVFNFVSVITTLSYKYTIFREDGTPVRATMDVTFRESEDSSARQGQQSPPQGIAGHRVFIVRPGDTLQGVAQKEYGNPKLWRLIADCNNLDNPKDLVPGQVLKVENLPV